jgi:hypothetical protein
VCAPLAGHLALGTCAARHAARRTRTAATGGGNKCAHEGYTGAGAIACAMGAKKPAVSRRAVNRAILCTRTPRSLVPERDAWKNTF